MRPKQVHASIKSAQQLAVDDGIRTGVIQHADESESILSQ
jgi:hypothetical protein